MSVHLKIVVTILATSSILGIWRGAIPYLQIYLITTMRMTTIEAKINSSLLSGVVGYIINPVILFVVSYPLGKGLDLKAELRSTILSILLSGFIGYSLALHVDELIITYQMTGELFPVGGYFLLGDYVIPNILISTVTSLPYITSLFFVSFTAIAISNTRKHQPKLQPPLATQTP